MFAASKTSAGIASVPSTGDPYWNSVSLLTNFENNLAFADSSANNFPVTRVSTVIPSLNTPFNGIGGSLKFNGTSTYISISNNAALNMDTSSFTAEAFIYLTATPGTNGSYSGGMILNKDGKNAVSWPQYALVVRSDLKVIASFSSVANAGISPTASIISSTTLSLNTWYHVAITRVGTSATLWINGVSNGGTSTVPSTLNDGARALLMGYEDSAIAAAYFPGFISNARVIKGMALYTSTFTPPTAPLTAVSGTSLLVTGTNQGMFDNSTFVDQGPNALTVTATGSPLYSGKSPFGNVYPGSLYYNGSSLIAATANAAYVIGTGDFTFEAWIYVVADGATNNNGNREAVIFRNAITGNVSFQFMLSGNTTTTGTGLQAYSSNGMNVTGIYSFSKNTWYHVATSRNSGTVKLFVNGIQISSVSSAQSIGSASNSMEIGGSTYSGFSDRLIGFISNSRMVKGTALYTSNFTPSTTPLTTVTNTTLLVRGDTGTFYDLSNNGNPEANTGTTAVTTQIKQYGTESASYTATAYQTVNDAANLQFGSGDYTIEMWVYCNAVGVLHSLACKGAATTGWLLQINTSNQLVFTVASTVILTSTATISAAVWTFVTVTRSGTSTRLFVNGNLQATATDSTNFTQTDALKIGADRSNANGLNGYIDDMRITKGVARYTTTFTPPTQTFPTGP